MTYIEDRIMIVCKMYIDNINGEDCIVTELAKRNIPQGITNIVVGVDEDKISNVHIYPSNYVAISKEAKDALMKKIDVDDDWVYRIFDTDYMFSTDNYKSNIGGFSFLPKKHEGENRRKKIFYLKDTLKLDTAQLWLNLLDGMPIYDNEYLKNLDLTEPIND